MVIQNPGMSEDLKQKWESAQAERAALIQSSRPDLAAGLGTQALEVHLELDRVLHGTHVDQMTTS